MNAPLNASTAVAQLTVDVLLAGGVREVVLAPGSRSAPLAYAVDAAARAGKLRLHTRIDERTAAFLALGLAKSSRRPAAIVTTSGTATANLHPAMLEAHHSGVRLVAVTADRPAELRGTNANQTTVQTHLYGDAVRAFEDVAAVRPGPDEAEQLLRARRQLARGVARGVWWRGPVHLNIAFAEPLVPGQADGWATPLPEGLPGELTDVTPGEVDATSWTALEPAARGVVVAGDDAGKSARILAEALGWPLFAEPSSGARYGHHALTPYRLLLSGGLAEEIDTVVVCGHPTLSRPITRLISRSDLAQFSVAGPLGATDPGRRQPIPLELSGVGEAPKRTSPWLERWQRADAVARAEIQAVLSTSGFTGYDVAAELAAALPDRGMLYVGASNPIRDLDLVMHPARVGGRRLILANRGLAGIDGTLSSAIGAALARPSSRSFALLGDVTFLHDAGALVIGPDEPRPDLQIVVVNDDGGSIFSLLEQGAAEYSDNFERLFATPHGVNLARWCEGTGIRHRGVTSCAELAQALADPGPGIEVVEAQVGRAQRRELDQHLRSRVLQALELSPE